MITANVLGFMVSQLKSIFLKLKIKKKKKSRQRAERFGEGGLDWGELGGGAGANVIRIQLYAILKLLH